VRSAATLELVGVKVLKRDRSAGSRSAATTLRHGAERRGWFWFILKMQARRCEWFVIRVLSPVKVEDL